MTRPWLDRLLKRLDADGGLDRYRVGTAQVGSPALAEKADIGARLFLGLSIDWPVDAKVACRLLRVPTDDGGLWVLTAVGRMEVITFASTLDGLGVELDRLELNVRWKAPSPFEHVGQPIAVPKA